VKHRFKPRYFAVGVARRAQLHTQQRADVAKFSSSQCYSASALQNGGIVGLPVCTVCHVLLCRSMVGRRALEVGHVCAPCFSRTRLRVRDQTSSRTICMSTTNAFQVNRFDVSLCSNAHNVYVN